MRSFLARDLAAEQRGFLGRDRAHWRDHLEQVRGFLGEGLQSAQPGAPVLILGAGSGLEVPWRLAPPATVGWDADPWSRIRTWFRHGRGAPWVFQDLTGGLESLAALALRTTRRPWSGQLRATQTTSRRLAGLIATLQPQPEPLRAWIARHRPGTILAANVMGQFGAGARRIVERAFAGRHPWTVDPELPDPLDEALQDWTARALRAWIAVLLESGADLWLVHDRAVVYGQVAVRLGPLVDDWTAQLRADEPLEVLDPLCGVHPGQELCGREASRLVRWIWPLAPGQTHLMEAMRVSPGDGILRHNRGPVLTGAHG